jgi:hypothetical protein
MKICILNLIFLFLYFNGFSQTLTQEQKNIIIERVQGFDALKEILTLIYTLKY